MISMLPTRWMHGKGWKSSAENADVNSRGRWDRLICSRQWPSLGSASSWQADGAKQSKMWLVIGHRYLHMEGIYLIWSVSNLIYPSRDMSPESLSHRCWRKWSSTVDDQPKVPPWQCQVWNTWRIDRGIVTISIFGSTSIPFPLYFVIHFPTLFKSSFTISITKLFYFQPFYYSAFYYSAFYYSAFLLFSSITQQHFC